MLRAPVPAGRCGARVGVLELATAPFDELPPVGTPAHGRPSGVSSHSPSPLGGGLGGNKLSAWIKGLPAFLPKPLSGVGRNVRPVSESFQRCGSERFPSPSRSARPCSTSSPRRRWTVFFERPAAPLEDLLERQRLLAEQHQDLLALRAAGRRLHRPERAPALLVELDRDLVRGSGEARDDLHDPGRARRVRPTAAAARPRRSRRPSRSARSRRAHAVRTRLPPCAGA